MNAPKAIELAMSETIRKFAEVGEGVTIRAWQSLESDGSWVEDTDRSFPMIDVRCGPPKTDDNQSTLQVECAILMGTKTDDDKSHAFISDMYDAVQGVIDDMFVVFRSGTFTTDPLKYFLAQAVISGRLTSSTFQFGGLTIGDGLAPNDDGGVNMIGITLTIHYGRSDF